MIDFEKGIVNKGNWNLIQQCMKRAQAGEDITVAFLGGSITQGSLSSTPQTCYAYRIYEWWQKRFPQAKVHYVNAGIGGTSSQFGAARVKEDVLAYAPDFMITEFSVNDGNTEHFKETYEGLIRTILQAPKTPALMLLHNYYYKDRVSAEEVHLEVGKHYDLPCVSMKSTIQAEILDGKLTVADISPDGLHPNDAGHKLVSEGVIYLLEKIYEETDKQLPPPLTLNRYENSMRYQNCNSKPQCRGFVEDTTPQNGITDCFRRGFAARETGSKITFEIEACCIAVQYRKSVKKPAPIARCTIDGNLEKSVLLDANFEEDWGDCLYLEAVYEGNECRKHCVEIEIIQGTGEEETPFYLVSVIGAREEKE